MAPNRREFLKTAGVMSAAAVSINTSHARPQRNDQGVKTIQTPTLESAFEEHGDLEGFPVILLHGFPEFWQCWKHQIDFFSGRGFRVIVPDQRGYNTSSKPSSVSSYRAEPIARDVLGLMESLGRRKAYIVGHDWGGFVAWYLGNRFPQWVEKLAVLNLSLIHI